MTVHVYPLGDLVEHELVGDECVCGPDVVALIAVDGTVDWRVIHHPLDARELELEAAHEPGGGGGA